MKIYALYYKDLFVVAFSTREAFENLTKQARTLQNELKEVKEATNFDRNLGQLGECVS